jgi:hypothetical protein
VARDDDSLVDLDELASVLRAHEGPPQAKARPAEPSGARGGARSLRVRWGLVVVALALLAGSGLGFGLGSSVTPSGGAAEAPTGLGFLPERGWHVVRSRFEATPERPSFAIASNVPLDRQDAQVAGRMKFSGHPNLTLQSLEPGGVVLVASFALRGVHTPSDESFPRRTLPLRLRDAASEIQPSYYGPRSRPVGLYELRAAVGEHNVIVSVYFGTLRPAKALIVAAQRQLDRLVVGSTRPAARVAERALPLRPAVDTATVAGSASRIVDRTFACNPIAFGGVGDLDISVSPPRDLGAVQVSAHLTVSTGGFNPESRLVVVRARPQASSRGFRAEPAGVFAHSQRCSPARAPVPLSSNGLPGQPVRWEKELDCALRGRVLLHVRSTLQRPANWRRIDRSYEGARQPVVETKLSVRLQKTGEPIAYMELNARGRTKLWYSSGCS